MSRPPIEIKASVVERTAREYHEARGRQMSAQWGHSVSVSWENLAQEEREAQCAAMLVALNAFLRAWL